MSKMYNLKVCSVERETADSVLVSLEVPDEDKEAFAFRAGQYITLEAEIEGEKVRRAYSLCVAPEEQKWQVGIKRVPGGKFSVFASERLKAGDTLSVLPPDGKFTLPEVLPAGKKQYLAFVAGSGITPVMALLKHILKTDEKASFVLFYGNKTAEDVMFREELEQLKNRYLGRLVVHHIFSREQTAAPLFHGRINPEKVKAFAGRLFQPGEINMAFVCGPGEMVVDVVDALKELGTDEAKLKYELFTPSRKKTDRALASSDVTKQKIEKVEMVIELDGDEFTMEADSRLTILDTGLVNDLDLPYACKAGVCCTCKAKLIEGEVKMERADSLDEDEIRAGYILSCQAFPASEKLKVDFDV